jgi:hypothetical protein
MLIAITLATQAQNAQTDTLTWSSQRSIELESSTPVQQHASVVIYGSSRIDWIQHNVNRTYRYKVTGTEGSWPQVTTDGQITYFIQYGNITGTVVCRRQQGIASIEFTLTKASQVIQRLHFDIESVTINGL